MTILAAERLEAALERLAEALKARFAVAPEARPVDPGPVDMVPRAEVERLATRLDEALARLRALLGEDGDAET
jgi:hypothetical protein